MRNKIIETYCGQLIKNARLHLNKTQLNIAFKAGYDSSQIISNIERGVQMIPKIRIKEFAKALEITEDQVRNAILNDIQKAMGGV